MKTIKIFSAIIIFASITYSQPGWIDWNYSGGTNLSAGHFNDMNTGWAAGQFGTIIKTTDNCHTWVQQSTTISTWLNSVYFIGNKGWAVGTVGTILYTTNGGTNWLGSAPYSYSLFDVDFVNESIGFTAGLNGYILKTETGGTSWLTGGNISPVVDLFSIEFTNPYTGWVSGQGGKIFKTTNGGINWVQQSTPVVNLLDEIYAVNDLYLFCSGDNGTVLKTTNGGTNWVQTNTGVTQWLHSVNFINVLTGWSCGDEGVIIKTTNGGINWVRQESYTANSLAGIFFYSSIYGWAVGTGGRVLRTTNGGEPIGIQQISHEIPVQFSILQNYPNPFNPVTSIEFTVPKKAFISLRIFNSIGKEIDVLVNKNLLPGTYRYEWNASSYPSGIYFYTLQSENFAETKKMILIK